MFSPHLLDSWFLAQGLVLNFWFTSRQFSLIWGQTGERISRQITGKKCRFTSLKRNHSSSCLLEKSGMLQALEPWQGFCTGCPFAFPTTSQPSWRKCEFWTGHSWCSGSPGVWPCGAGRGFPWDRLSLDSSTWTKGKGKEGADCVL